MHRSRWVVIFSSLAAFLCSSPLFASLPINAPAPANYPEVQTNTALAQARFQIFAGNGNHAIDPNECNALNLILTNVSSTGLSALNASLVSTDPDVIITQPLAAFAGVAAHGTVTNTVPFQISTLQSFSAGRTISANLLVTTSNNTTTVVPIALPTDNATVATDGGGACELCSFDTIVTNTLSTNSSLLPERLFRDSNPSSCGSTKPFPGTITGPFSYQAYPFYNGASNTCINVTLVTADADIMSAAFAGTFNPTNPQATWLADSGNSTAGATTISYSFQVRPDTVFIILVNNVTADGTYQLEVSGGNCAPHMNLALASTNKVDVIWPAVSGNFKLESSPQIKPATWTTITNEPVAHAGRFNVTNRSDLTPERLYRLHGF
jgi:hypothetical protein